MDGFFMNPEHPAPCPRNKKQKERHAKKKEKPDCRTKRPKLFQWQARARIFGAATDLPRRGHLQRLRLPAGPLAELDPLPAPLPPPARLGAPPPDVLQRLDLPRYSGKPPLAGLPLLRGLQQPVFSVLKTR